MWFLFKILHVRGRNICLYKGELCFILLGGVFTFLLFYELFFRFLYIGLVTIFTYIMPIFDIYIYIYDVCLLHLSLHVLFLFFFYTHFSSCMQSLFLFHTWCLIEFCLSVSKKQIVKVYHAMNFLFAKFFKGLC